MHFARQEDIALLFMSELGRHYTKRYVSLSEVSSEHGVSLLFLKKIARMLRKAKLVHSKEGSGGGYILARAPHEINVWEIVRSVDEHIRKRATLGRPEHCPLNAKCLPQHIDITLGRVLQESFQHVTLDRFTA